MFDDFTQSLDQRWTQTCIGGGSLNIVDSALRMEFASAQVGKYTDAQVDDYDGLARSAFPWKPPLRMEVRARSSHPAASRSEEHTSELQSPDHLVCRLLLEKKKQNK